MKRMPINTIPKAIAPDSQNPMITVNSLSLDKLRHRPAVNQLFAEEPVPHGQLRVTGCRTAPFSSAAGSPQAADPVAGTSGPCQNREGPQLRPLPPSTIGSFGSCVLALVVESR